MSQRTMSAREVAALVGKSKSTVNRDATAERIPHLDQFPGYNGPRLFDPEAVKRAYGIKEAS